MMTPEQIRQMIESGLTGSEARVAGDDGTHFEAVIICDDFQDKSTLQRHQMVYRTLGDKMGTEIHALSMQTCTRDEWRQSAGSGDESA